MQTTIHDDAIFLRDEVKAQTFMFRLVVACCACGVVAIIHSRLQESSPARAVSLLTHPYHFLHYYPMMAAK